MVHQKRSVQCGLDRRRGEEGPGGRVTLKPVLDPVDDRLGELRQRLALRLLADAVDPRVREVLVAREGKERHSG